MLAGNSNILDHFNLSKSIESTCQMSSQSNESLIINVDSYRSNESNLDLDPQIWLGLAVASSK